MSNICSEIESVASSCHPKIVVQVDTSAVESAITRISNLNSGVATAGYTHNARGTKFSRDDVYIAGEEGPELIVGGYGSRVYTANETADILDMLEELTTPRPFTAVQTSEPDMFSFMTRILEDLQGDTTARDAAIDTPVMRETVFMDPMGNARTQETVVVPEISLNQPENWYTGIPAIEPEIILPEQAYEQGLMMLPDGTWSKIPEVNTNRGFNVSPEPEVKQHAPEELHYKKTTTETVSRLEISINGNAVIRSDGSVSRKEIESIIAEQVGKKAVEAVMNRLKEEIYQEGDRSYVL